MIFKTFDVIITGSGISGLYTSLNLDKSIQALILSKGELSLSNSALAQGGVAAVMDKENDSFQQHINDTLIAGKHKNNLSNLTTMVEQGPTDINKLIELGANFDTNFDQSLKLTLEGGHSRNRIVFHKDSTGYEIESKLIHQVKQQDNISVVDNSVLCGLEKRDGYFFAEILRNGKFYHFAARRLVLATGGIGRLYNFTTNSAIATGDGIGFAYELGAKIKNLSYIQFHPTAFADKNNRESFLISEAVRGEGAYLLNCKKERFMDKYEPVRRELAPRDVVSKCIIEESRLTGSNDFYLDISHMDSEFVKNRFPMIYQNVLNRGYDMTKEPIPVFPCQHYAMGGIDVDNKGETNVQGLYAAGECSHTGVHGENRLASNSLLEALVFSRLIAEDINSKHTGKREEFLDNPHFPTPDGIPLPTGIRTKSRQIMQEAFFVIPNYEKAETGLKEIEKLKNLLESNKYQITRDYIETRSLVISAYIILKEVLDNKEK